jgi:lipopolysaccharide transport system permease protein
MATAPTPPQTLALGLSAAAAPGRVHVRPRPGWRPIDFAELWHYRELLWILAGRDIKVRYKQTALGALWAVIPPVFTMLIFTFIFGTVAKMDTSGVPYPIFSFSALVPWWLFANSLTQSSNSLVGSQNLITKVYFPRLVIPISSILSALLDFSITLLLLAGMMAYYHDSVHVGLGLLALPLLVALAVTCALAVGLWLSALNVQYRDIRYVIPFLVQFWMYASPVLYSSSKIPARWRLLYGLNPMAGVVEGFRWALIGKTGPPGPMLAVSVASVIVLLIGGLFYFRRMEKSFADLV